MDPLVWVMHAISLVIMFCSGYWFGYRKGNEDRD